MNGAVCIINPHLILCRSKDIVPIDQWIHTQNRTVLCRGDIGCHWQYIDHNIVGQFYPIAVIIRNSDSVRPILNIGRVVIILEAPVPSLGTV